MGRGGGPGNDSEDRRVREQTDSWERSESEDPTRKTTRHWKKSLTQNKWRESPSIKTSRARVPVMRGEMTIVVKSGNTSPVLSMLNGVSAIAGTLPTAPSRTLMFPRGNFALLPKASVAGMVIWSGSPAVTVLEPQRTVKAGAVMFTEADTTLIEKGLPWIWVSEAGRTMLTV